MELPELGRLRWCFRREDNLRTRPGPHVLVVAEISRIRRRLLAKLSGPNDSHFKVTGSAGPKAANKSRGHEFRPDGQRRFLRVHG